MRLQFLKMIVFTGLIGCVEVQDQKGGGDKIHQTAVAQVSTEIEALEAPQSYRVRFHGVKCEPHCEVILNKAGLHQYPFASVSIPKDLVIQGRVELASLQPQDLKVEGRLFFTKGSKLVTNGARVQLEVGDLFSQGGEIVTWDSESQALPGQHGADGGVIHLKVKNLKGPLQVVLRGQKGGSGETPMTTRKAIRDLDVNGKNGGNTGRLILEVENISQGLVHLKSEPGRPGEGVEVTNFCMGSDCQRLVLRPRGRDGQPGLPEKSCEIRNGQCTEPTLN